MSWFSYFHVEPRTFPVTEAMDSLRRCLAKVLGPSAFVYFMSLDRSSDWPVNFLDLCTYGANIDQSKKFLG